MRREDIGIATLNSHAVSVWLFQHGCSLHRSYRQFAGRSGNYNFLKISLLNLTCSVRSSSKRMIGQLVDSCILLLYCSHIVCCRFIHWRDYRPQTPYTESPLCRCENKFTITKYNTVKCASSTTTTQYLYRKRRIDVIILKAYYIKIQEGNIKYKTFRLAENWHGII